MHADSAATLFEALISLRSAARRETTILESTIPREFGTLPRRFPYKFAARLGENRGYFDVASTFFDVFWARSARGCRAEHLAKNVKSLKIAQTLLLALFGALLFSGIFSRNLSNATPVAVWHLSTPQKNAPKTSQNRSDATPADVWRTSIFAQNTSSTHPWTPVFRSFLQPGAFRIKKHRKTSIRPINK